LANELTVVVYNSETNGAIAYQTKMAAFYVSEVISLVERLYQSLP
jgi:hypothetical protein